MSVASLSKLPLTTMTSFPAFRATCFLGLPWLQIKNDRVGGDCSMATALFLQLPETYGLSRLS